MTLWDLKQGTSATVDSFVSTLRAATEPVLANSAFTPAN